MVWLAWGRDLNLVLRPGLDMAGRPRVTTWNWCHDWASPLCVVTRPLVSRPSKRAWVSSTLQRAATRHQALVCA